LDAAVAVVVVMVDTTRVLVVIGEIMTEIMTEAAAKFQIETIAAANPPAADWLSRQPLVCDSHDHHTPFFFHSGGRYSTIDQYDPKWSLIRSSIHLVCYAKSDYSKWLIEANHDI
jgi:hypothetical protein